MPKVSPFHKENPKLVGWDCYWMVGTEELLDVLTESKASCMITTTDREMRILHCRIGNRQKTELNGRTTGIVTVTGF